jgi:hypothetical protein
MRPPEALVHRAIRSAFSSNDHDKLPEALLDERQQFGIAWHFLSVLEANGWNLYEESESIAIDRAVVEEWKQTFAELLGEVSDL